jgi:hypothetical protein
MRRHLKIIFHTEIYKGAPNNEAAQFLTGQICQEVHSYYCWRWVEIECRHVEQVHKEFGDGTIPGQPLPVRYDRALGALELFLVNQVIFRARFLEQVLPLTPGFSRHWSLQRTGDLPPGPAQAIRNSSTNSKESLAEDPLDWCLTQMLGKPDEQSHFHHDMLFAFLQHHLSTANAKEKGRLGENIYQHLSDIATSHEMLVSIRLHRPQNTARMLDEVKVTENREGCKRLRKELSPVSGKVLENVGSALIEDIYREKPPMGSRNIAWLRRSRTTRAALEKF